MIYEYEGAQYPDYLKSGNACRFIAPVAAEFCKGKGLDVGSGQWPLAGAVPVEIADGGDAMDLPAGEFDYVFSSHCLEHLADPIGALQHWMTRLFTGGVLFLYLPHPDMKYWQPTRNRKHLHMWAPEAMAQILKDLGCVNVLHSQRDMAWGFSVVGFKPAELQQCACGGTVYTDSFHWPKKPVQWFLRCGSCGATTKSVSTAELAAAIKFKEVPCYPPANATS